MNRRVNIDPREWDGFSERIGAEVMTLARQIAEDTGSCPIDVLLNRGLASEAKVYHALADHLELPYRDGSFVIRRERLGPGLAWGIVDIEPVAGVRAVLSPRGGAVEAVLACSAGLRRLPGLAVVPPRLLEGRLHAALGPELLAAGSAILPDADPKSSAKTGLGPWASSLLAVFVLLLVLIPALDIAVRWSAIGAGLGVFYLLVLAHRLLCVGASLVPTPEPGPLLPDRDLPFYSVLVPVHREARIAADLAQALLRLDYPPEKLDIRILLEEHDVETRRAFERLGLPGHFTLVVCPDGQPRTKPRALNIGLALARGSFVAVFDAEDVPEPRQLRLAATVFAKSPASLACLQAALVVDRTGGNWLTHQFALDYAALFDVHVGGAAACGFPIALGGTSNHFRRAILDRLLAWDAWNVTEDADLGLRMARAGYRIGQLPSSTREEMPQKLGAWLNQRTRWLKGWMQTLVVQLRQPGRLTPMGALVILTALAPLVTALFGPLLAIAFVVTLANGTLLAPETVTDLLVSALGIAVFTLGSLLLAFTLLIGSLRRRIPLRPWDPVLHCAYLLMVSVAAWRALWEIAERPHHWAKTEHGLVPRGSGEPARETAVEGVGVTPRTVRYR